jgi:hypothetical protein
MNYRVTNGHSLDFPIAAGIAPSSIASTDEIFSSKEKDEAKKKSKEQPKDKPKRVRTCNILRCNRKVNTVTLRNTVMWL